jgi:hypothetical protein
MTCARQITQASMRAHACRWRAAALEALQAFIAGPLRGAAEKLPDQARALQERATQLLAPTLDAICSSPPLQVGGLCRLACL